MMNVLSELRNLFTITKYSITRMELFILF